MRKWTHCKETGFSKINWIFFVPPKTKNAIRKIPMTTGVLNSMKYLISRAEEIRERKQKSYAGIDDFIMLSKRNGLPVSGYTYARTFTRFEKEYKEKYGQDIKVSPHICRHTFSSNCAIGGMPPKSLQKLMGHANFRITMDVYTDIGFDSIKQDFQKAAVAL